MKQLDPVVLTRDLPAHRLKAGDLGAVLHIAEGGDVFEVEFVRADGRTHAVASLTAADLRPVEGAEILHVRKLASD